jgi:DNA primase
MQERFLFPVWDREKKLVGAVGRTYVDSSLRYLSYDGFDSKLYLYGEHLIDSTRESAVLVEGPVDRIMAGRVLPNVLGLFGDQITPQRKSKLKRWFDSVTILMDGDRAGRVSEIRIGATLAPVMKVYVARLPWGYDPGNAGARRIQDAFDHRIFWANLP